VKIDYSLESKPLSTIAPLTLIGDLPEHFLLLNGDVLTDLSFRRMYDEHVAENRLFTVSAANRDHKTDYGVLYADSSHIMVGFEEKPTTRHLVSMGVYAVSRLVLARIPPDSKYGFDDLMRDLLEAGEPVYVRPHSGYWLDIGRPDDYMQAIDDFETKGSQFLVA
jgi:NDP-mannose synthase